MGVTGDDGLGTRFSAPFAETKTGQPLLSVPDM